MCYCLSSPVARVLRCSASIDPAIGLSWCYAGLTGYLGPGVRLCGLPAQGIDGVETFPPSIGAISLLVSLDSYPSDAVQTSLHLSECQRIAGWLGRMVDDERILANQPLAYSDGVKPFHRARKELLFVHAKTYTFFQTNR